MSTKLKISKKNVKNYQERQLAICESLIFLLNNYYEKVKKEEKQLSSDRKITVMCYDKKYYKYEVEKVREKLKYLKKWINKLGGKANEKS